MNRIDWFVLCPVPRDQRPFYEYIRRKQSNLVGWVGLNESGYASRFFVTLLALFSLSFPITSWIVSFSYYPLESFLINLIFCLAVQALIYGYFFVAWVYAGRRLLAAKVWYEESGWYDGKVWIKPPSILRHERLLYHYQLVPLVTRLGKTLRLIVVAIVVLSSLLLLNIY